MTDDSTVLGVERATGNALSRRLTWLWSRPTVLVDAAIALAFVAVEFGFLPTYRAQPYLGLVGPSYTGPDLSERILVVLALLPLVWRQRAPLASLGATAGLHGLVTALGVPLSWLALGAGLYEVALRYPRRVTLYASIGLTVGGSAAFVVGLPLSLGWFIYVVLALVSTFVTTAAVGRRVRRRRIHEHELGDQERREAQRAVVAERARVARELHDILADSISVMVTTAARGRQVLDADPNRAAEALASIEATGRASMAEVRRLLGMLRGEVVEPDLAPQPGLDALEDLLGQVRAAGLPVSVTVEGDRRPLNPSVELSVYRILQEAFTNVLKHARGARVTVHLVYGRERLLVAVRDAGAQPWRVIDGDGGTGLLGMRERAQLVGGSLSAGPLPSGGFELVAELPLAEAAAPEPAR